MSPTSDDEDAAPAAIANGATFAGMWKDVPVKQLLPGEPFFVEGGKKSVFRDDMYITCSGRVGALFRVSF